MERAEEVASPKLSRHACVLFQEGKKLVNLGVTGNFGPAAFSCGSCSSGLLEGRTER